jgi:hypothetical protein
LTLLIGVILFFFLSKVRAYLEAACVDLSDAMSDLAGRLCRADCVLACLLRSNWHKGSSLGSVLPWFWLLPLLCPREIALLLGTIQNATLVASVAVYCKYISIPSSATTPKDSISNNNSMNISRRFNNLALGLFGGAAQ